MHLPEKSRSSTGKLFLVLAISADCGFCVRLELAMRPKYIFDLKLRLKLTSLPLATFDVRGRQFGQAKLWSAPSAFGTRAFFRTATSPAQLMVDDLTLEDEGVYRCRVDFRNSPTRNLKINLTVIEIYFPFSFDSFDVRGRQFGQAKLWSAPSAFGTRAFFRTATSPAQLMVDDLTLEDEGVYRCRVDFRNSPTRNLKINLTVIGEYYFAFNQCIVGQ
ncbi:hypothetical protein J437_LFUL000137 [Ladona fulva]|uniref:Ig-like domain-containing protein n=1 Tax=Ladona fulva TaxID=123851 RepID=A0A8K0K6H5_LADFU|nr:hypothetical protein J437_LFUL000137 [Ladona fulva]